ncbi:hypothetical protein ACFT8P_04510 [Streptomyces sp. NPDC057101]|uniref:hypothetical protein n=1 Tax=Streptomyces sp. NPDC057101 TaxID=3346020 RepID=UPI00363D51D4
MYELATLARGGVLLTVWAVAAGWPPGRLAGRLRREGWQRICRGAWAVPGKEVDWRVRATALQLLRPELVCSHGTAAGLHRIERLGAAEWIDLLEFTALRPARSTRGDRIRVRATAHLTDRDRTTRRGLRTTTPARTVGDLIRGCAGREEAVVTADSALARRMVGGVRREALVRYEELAAELAAPRRGAARARAWLRRCARRTGGCSSAPTSSSGRRAWRSRSRATPSTAPAGPTNGTSPASTRCSPARRCGGCCGSRRGRSSTARTA